MKMYRPGARRGSSPRLLWSNLPSPAALHARARIDPTVRRRSELPEVWGRDVGQSRGKAQSQGAGLQVQGPKLRRGDLAAPSDICGRLDIEPAAGTARFRWCDRAHGWRTCPGGRGERRASRCRWWRARGLGRHATVPDLRRRDVGRPHLQAQPASARLQVPQQASRARRARLRGGDLAVERWLAEPVPAFDGSPTGGHVAGGTAALGGTPTRRQAAPGRRRSAVLRRRLLGSWLLETASGGDCFPRLFPPNQQPATQSTAAPAGALRLALPC
jgi:hypothetical protein